MQCRGCLAQFTRSALLTNFSGLEHQFYLRHIYGVSESFGLSIAANAHQILTINTIYITVSENTPEKIIFLVEENKTYAL